MTRRSRSSFDLSDALATAQALSPKPPVAEPRPSEFAGVPLVAFGRENPSHPPAALIAPSLAAARPAEPVVELAPAPDTSAIGGLMPKLSALLDWIRTDGLVSRALVVDDEGLPMVGMGASDLGETESLFAAIGSVASAMKKLALATPGAVSPDFEGHVGEGPVLQLIGLGACGRAFVVAISRRSPLGTSDVEAVRVAFAHALENSNIGASLVPGSGRGRPSGEP